MKPAIIGFRLRTAPAWLVALSLAGMAPALRSNDLAVRRGQQTIDARKLPFICLSVGFINNLIPLDSITFERATTGEEEVFSLKSLLSEAHSEYPTAVSRNVSLSLLVLALKPGSYRIKELEWDPPGPGVNRMFFDPPKQSRFYFRVKPGLVNYLGCLLIKPVVPKGGLIMAPKRNEMDSTRFGVFWGTERTARRDYKWACDIIPGMRRLPSAESALGSN